MDRDTHHLFQKRKLSCHPLPTPACLYYPPWTLRIFSVFVCNKNLFTKKSIQIDLDIGLFAQTCPCGLTPLQINGICWLKVLTGIMNNLTEVE